MRTEAYIVTLRIPDHMPSAEVASQLRTCISFGRPEIKPLYVLPDDVQEEITHD